MKLKRYGVKVVVLSDVHLGQAAFNEVLFQNYLKYIVDQDAYVVLGGDLMEFAIPVHMPQTMFGQVLSTQDQIDAIETYLMPIRDRIIFLTAGNHENRQWKKTGTDVSLNLAEKLGCFYSKPGGLFRTTTGKQSYTWGVFHGSSAAGINIWGELERRWSVHPQADIIAMGHVHQLAHKTLPKFNINEKGAIERRYVHYVRTGSFLSGADYALEEGYHPTLDGAPIIFLDTDRHNVEIDVQGEMRWK